MCKLISIFVLIIVFTSADCLAQRVHLIKDPANRAQDYAWINIKSKTAADLVTRSDAIIEAELVSGHMDKKKNCYELSVNKLIKGKIASSYVCSDLHLKIGGKYILFTYRENGGTYVSYAMQVIAVGSDGTEDNGLKTTGVVIEPNSKGDVVFLLDNPLSKTMALDVHYTKFNKEKKILIYSYYPYNNVVMFIKKIIHEHNMYKQSHWKSQSPN